MRESFDRHNWSSSPVGAVKQVHFDARRSFLKAIPLRNHKAPVVPTALMLHVFLKYGAPQQLLSDRAAEFDSELFTELMSWMKIDKLHTTVFKPSTKAVVERFYKTLYSMLAKSV